MVAQDHGHSTAAWTAVVLALAGFVVGGVALVLAAPWLFFVGVGLLVLAAVSGKVLQMMGLGAKDSEQVR
ncbi:MAG TPA: HGxxPAAW family protein [Actinomycetes bacterium]|nr:HGxxPAAW family protein [Actinomycetes bacterium]